jgi:hypothetical protein
MADAEALTPGRTPDRLLELSPDDVRAAVLLDAAGVLVGCSDPDPERARTLGELARELFEAVDDAADGQPAQQVEAQVPSGAVFASRTPRWMLAAVARRSALSSLMLFDLKALLGELEGGPPIRRSLPAEEPVPHDFEDSGKAAAGESPVPELGEDPA